jgi:ferredoxin
MAWCVRSNRIMMFPGQEDPAVFFFTVDDGDGRRQSLDNTTSSVVAAASVKNEQKVYASAEACQCHTCIVP